jgi:hypothetical protein
METHDVIGDQCTPLLAQRRCSRGLSGAFRADECGGLTTDYHRASMQGEAASLVLKNAHAHALKDPLDEILPLASLHLKINDDTTSIRDSKPADTFPLDGQVIFRSPGGSTAYNMVMRIFSDRPFLDHDVRMSATAFLQFLQRQRDFRTDAESVKGIRIPTH